MAERKNDKMQLSSSSKRRFERVSNWTALKQSWPYFIKHVKKMSWIGPTSETLVIELLMKDHVPIGQIMLKLSEDKLEPSPLYHYILDSSTAGSLCTGYIKCSESVCQHFTMCLKNGMFCMLEFGYIIRKCPIELLNEFIAQMNHGVFPKDASVSFSADVDMQLNGEGFSAAEVLKDMQQLVLDLGRTWWGEMLCTRSELFEMLNDLEKRKSAEITRPSAAVIFVDEGARGYLFSVLSVDGAFYNIYFSAFGYVHSRHNRESYSRDLGAIVSHLCHKENLKLVDKPFRTLQELSRASVLKNGLFSPNDDNLPKIIKDFITDSPYFRYPGR
ncbi:hypothetical protein WMY93_031107 [Mugilogobius chulae]|uniref:Uncharacterized protein n=1 Tax=Mugilogobius chulae TaxID=88201 RepID=A0AAW0ME61_9GOBI